MNLIKNKNNVITYTVSKYMNSSLFISVQNGEVVVKAPWYYTNNQIQNVIEEKRKWIIEKINQTKIETQKEYIRNEIVKILGKDCKVIVNYKNLKKPTLTVEGQNIKISLPNTFKKLDKDEILIKLIEKLYDTLAEKEIERAMERARKILGFAPEDYKICRMKNMIGKCNNEEKIITINPDIVQYSREIIDYVVLHEFCHLKCKTHSKSMQQMISEYEPNYKKYEQQLINIKY